MSTLATTAALESALLTVLSSPPEGTVSLPRIRAFGVDVPAWCEKHGLLFWRNGRTLTLKKKGAFGWLRMDFAAAHPTRDLTAYMDGRYCDYDVEHEYQAWTKAGREGAAQ